MEYGRVYSERKKIPKNSRLFNRQNQRLDKMVQPLFYPVDLYQMWYNER